MIDISIINAVMGVYSIMRIQQQLMLTKDQAIELKSLGEKLSRLRVARKHRQEDVAARACMSRNTLQRIEKGDGSVAIGQILRYLAAIAPGATLLDVLMESDPALKSLEAQERKKRIRQLSGDALARLDF